MFGEGKPAHERAVDDAEKAHREAQSKVRESRVRVTDLERKVREAESEDEERLAYSSLDGRCINKKVAEYKYEVCFFDKAKQDACQGGTQAVAFLSAARGLGELGRSFVCSRLRLRCASRSRADPQQMGSGTWASVSSLEMQAHVIVDGALRARFRAKMRFLQIRVDQPARGRSPHHRAKAGLHFDRQVEGLGGPRRGKVR